MRATNSNQIRIGSRPGAGNPPARARLERRIRQYLSELHGIDIDHAWALEHRHHHGAEAAPARGDRQAH